MTRALVLVSGIVASAALGHSGRAPGFDPGGITHPFGALGNELIAPMARWDTVWFMAIADGGYGDDPARPAFFPLYPLLAKVVGVPFSSSLVGGILVSWIAFLVALTVLHRLASLELGDARAARFAVLACAVFPMAFFHTAMYSEGLFLVLSIGAVYAARQGEWAWAGALGALAAGTRSAGVLLVVPLALLWLRARRAAGLPLVGGGARSYAPLAGVALVPLGMLAFCGWFGLTGGDVRAPIDAQQVWFREFTGPFFALWDGWYAAVQGARQLLSGSRSPVYFTEAGGDPFVTAQDNLWLLAFLLACVPAIVGVLRRLPFAYGAYVVAALALPLSTPVGPQPLMSTPRFLAVLFPLYLWAGLALARRSDRTVTIALTVSALLLCFFTARFATWHFVA